MALRTQIVDFLRLEAVEKSEQARRVGQNRKMQEQPFLVLMLIRKDIVDARRVEAAGPALNAMHHVALLQQKFSQVGAVLTCDACDKRCFSGGWIHLFWSAFFRMGLQTAKKAHSLLFE